MPTNQSKIQLKGKPDSSVEINGFVVGIERFWHKELNQIIKVTSKAGGHTTIVRLLATQRGADQFTADFDVTFSSSMAYIVVSKSADGNLIVTTRDNHRGDNCQWITEDVFVMEGVKFNKISTIELHRKCL
ncbi:hypothetical protein KO505_12535 [Psychrosphaera sp. F3M07]|uniref:hypothetical protein n=1 Tax=Psychrosphaera sp. F3M07 TaxID=2841560 RepID=UPI001C09F8F7|nr:hypothetical protein [Psychrosphaera sp. F3M07]MBU2918777.1 hypothetical protein [Psychrosphaera sp. F3M07]